MTGREEEEQSGNRTVLEEPPKKDGTEAKQTEITTDYTSKVIGFDSFDRFFVDFWSKAKAKGRGDSFRGCRMPVTIQF